MQIQNNPKTSISQNLTPFSKAQNAGGGRYHSTLNIGLSQCLKIVLLYLSFVIFFLLTSKSVYADTFTTNSFKKLNTAPVIDKVTGITNEQCLLTVNKDSYVESVTVKVGETIISPAITDNAYNIYWINKGCEATISAIASLGYDIQTISNSTVTLNEQKTVNITTKAVPILYINNYNALSKVIVYKGNTSTIRHEYTSDFNIHMYIGDKIVMCGKNGSLRWTKNSAPISSAKNQYCHFIVPASATASTYFDLDGSGDYDIMFGNYYSNDDWITNVSFILGS